MIVSQVPVTEWHARFPDPTLADAVLDRTIHNAYRLSLFGDSPKKIARIPVHAAHLMYNTFDQPFLSPPCAAYSGFPVQLHRISQWVGMDSD